MGRFKKYAGVILLFLVCGCTTRDVTLSATSPTAFSYLARSAETRTPVAFQTQTPVPNDGVAHITLGDDYFNPAVLIIKTGTVVEWWHGGTKEHTIVSVQNQWAPIFPGYGSRHRLNFYVPGEYAYTCSLHSGMDAKIIVVP